MNDASHLIYSLLHGARTAFSGLPVRKQVQRLPITPAPAWPPRNLGLAHRKRCLAHGLMACNPEIAADLFAEAERLEAHTGN